MKASGMAILTCAIAACGSAPPPSLGDSPIHEVRCPSFLDRDGCLQRAERTCDGGQYTILSEPADKSVGEGSTVSIEGTIKHRIVTIRCDE